MHITMVKKVLADGSPCRKCVQAEEMLKRRKLWDRLDQVIVADERDPDSVGFQHAKRYDIETAPFFVVREGDKETLYTSPLELIRKVLKPRKTKSRIDVGSLRKKLDQASPQTIVKEALTHFGETCAIAFSGAEDVALVQMAADSGLPFSVFCLDTGRLHAETLTFIERVRTHYGIRIDVMNPEAAALQDFVRKKGLFSFFVDGHKECCGVRKVEPLRRILKTKRAWITGQRKDQSATRSSLDVVEEDQAFEGVGGSLFKFNPIANWSGDDVWAFLRDTSAPTNPLHDEGYRSIGCAPCTRPTSPEQHEREGRWWWEDEFKKECGLHLTASKNT